MTSERSEDGLGSKRDPANRRSIQVHCHEPPQLVEHAGIAMVPPKASPARDEPQQSTPQTQPHRPGLTVPLLVTSILVALLAYLPWARRWASSGAAIESLLVIYGYGLGSRILPFLDLWPLLATFNLAYAVCSTSWLLFGLFAATCYPVIFLTCLWQFAPAADLARKTLRKWLRQLHFTRDKIALFNLPALEIDVDVDGLLVVRGITIILSSLTVVAHGVELGVKLSNEIELAISVDEVTIALFRRITIGEVFGNLKGEEVEMMFADLGARADPDTDVDAVFVNNTPILRAATTGSVGFTDRPKFHKSLTRARYMKDSPARESLDPVMMLSPDDKHAETQYHDRLDDIRRNSAVGQSRAKARVDTEDTDGPGVVDEGESRMAVVTALQELPTVPHPPSHCVRVTTLQNLAPPWLRRFLHRLPFLLRLLLAPISYLHPITVSCVTAGVSGPWISTLLSQQTFKQYADGSAEITRLEEKVSAWLADANFCVQLRGFDALAQVPLKTVSDIQAQIKVNDIKAYRSHVEVRKATQIVQMSGGDGTIEIPSCLLPHHEHIIPASPSGEDEAAADEIVGKDEVEIKFNAHAKLPAQLDQSLLGFVAALVKATKIIELEKEFNGEPQPDLDMDEDLTPASPTSLKLDSEQMSVNSAPASPKGSPRFKTFARNVRQNLKDGTAGQSIKEFAKDLNQATRDSMKKAVVVGVVNDSWIAKVVGRIAAKLERAQGSFGYSGGIPISLEPYRTTPDGSLSKLLS